MTINEIQDGDLVRALDWNEGATRYEIPLEPEVVYPTRDPWYGDVHYLATENYDWAPDVGHSGVIDNDDVYSVAWEWPHGIFLNSPIEP